MRRVTLIVVLLLCNILMMAQRSSALKPRWMTSHLPIPQNNTYIFVKETGTGSTIDQAFEACLNQLATDKTLLSAASVSRKSENSTEIHQNIHNGVLDEIIDKVYNINVAIDGQKTTLQAYRIDDYYETINENGRQKYLMSVLYESAIQPNPVFNYARANSEYGIKDNWRAIIPGWAQMHKGDFVKGGIVMGGAVALAGGGFLCRLTKEDYKYKMSNTHNANVKQQYATKINNLNTGMYICVGGLAALYIYGIIDAFIAPGAKRIEVTSENGAVIHF